jgi:hypothetical protein
MIEELLSCQLSASTGWLKGHPAALTFLVVPLHSDSSRL